MKTATIIISQPCTESWASMTPTGAGRHCVACAKTVVDFTRKTDAEILAYLAQTAGNGCGRLRADQLARPLRAAAPVSRWRSWLSAVLAVGGVLGAAGRAAGQAATHSGGPEPVTAAPGGAADSSSEVVPGGNALKQPAAPVARKPLGNQVLHGVVVDESGQRLPGASVFIKGTTIGTATAADGSFTLPVTSTKAKIYIMVSYIGYETVELKVTAAEAVRPLAISMKTSYIMLGGMGFISPPDGLWQRLSRYFA